MKQKSKPTYLDNVRIITQSGVIWFSAKDIINLLNIRNHRDTVRRRIADSDKCHLKCKTNGGEQTLLFVNTNGAGSIINGSNNPNKDEVWKRILEIIPD